MESNLCKIGLAALVAVLTTAVAVAAGPVALKPSPALAPDLDAFPRVETSGDRAAKRINRALAEDDAAARKSAKECRAVAGKDSEWSRTITVMMRGPRYLSLLALDNWWCGGPYPAHREVALVYDLATGARVNWKRLLPASLAQETTGADDEVLSPTLQTLYVQAWKAGPTSDPECADVLADSTLSFLLWPDAEAGGIVVQPANVPHVVQACAESIVIAIPELRKLGVDAELVDAIEEAHRQGWYDKKG